MINAEWHLQVEVWPPAAPTLASGHKRRSEEPDANDHTVSSSFLYEGQEAAASSPRPDKLVKTGSAHHISAHPSKPQFSEVQHDSSGAGPNSHIMQDEHQSAAAATAQANGPQTDKAATGAGHATGRHQQPIGGAHQAGHAYDRARTERNAEASVPGSAPGEAADEAADMDTTPPTPTIAREGLESAQHFPQRTERRQADSLTPREDDTTSASIGESGISRAAQSLLNFYPV